MQKDALTKFQNQIEWGSSMEKIGNALKRIHQWSCERFTDGMAEDARGATGNSPHSSSPPFAITGDLNGDRPWPDSHSALPDSDPRYVSASDEFQVLCATLRCFASEQDEHLFAVTSAFAGEGKTFVAMSLAVSLVRSGARVLLVDANLNRPSLHHALGMERRLGMSDCLSGKASFESSIQATRLAGLAMISAGGPANSSPRALFVNPRMREFMAAARAAYARGFVMIDCPPLLASAEARIMVRMADALVMVVAANRTPRHSVARALGRMQGSTVAGMVLNRFEA